MTTQFIRVLKKYYATLHASSSAAHDSIFFAAWIRTGTGETTVHV